MATTGVVLNHDVVGLHSRINRFLEELIKSVSSSTSQVNVFDQERLKSYLGAILIYHDWVVGQPALDLPETHPREYALEASPVVPDVENENINDLVRLLVLAREELVNSQSARDPANLNKFDSARLLAVVAKAQAFLTEYIQKATPLDLPESSPQAVVSGSGRTGV